MKKKELRSLTLNRETLKRLDELALGEGVVGGVDGPPSSQICCPAPS